MAGLTDDVTSMDSEKKTFTVRRESFQIPVILLNMKIVCQCPSRNAVPFRISSTADSAKNRSHREFSGILNGI